MVKMITRIGTLFMQYLSSLVKQVEEKLHYQDSQTAVNKQDQSTIFVHWKEWKYHEVFFINCNINWLNDGSVYLRKSTQMKGNQSK